MRKRETERERETDTETETERESCRGTERSRKVGAAKGRKEVHT